MEENTLYGKSLTRSCGVLFSDWRDSEPAWWNTLSSCYSCTRILNPSDYSQRKTKWIFLKICRNRWLIWENTKNINDGALHPSRFRYTLIILILIPMPLLAALPAAKPSFSADREIWVSTAQIALPSANYYNPQKQFYQTSGFQIFLLLTIVVVWCALMWWIVKKSAPKSTPNNVEK